MKIPVVNEQDEIIGYKERENILLGDIIRITAICITDGKSNTLLAQRSLDKKNSPGKWGPGVAGTVEEGETYESNAYKELSEEIGLEGLKLTPIKKVLYSSNTGTKFCYFYNLQIPQETKLKIKRDEVEQVKWFSKEELVKYLQDKPEDFVQSSIIFKDFILEMI